MQQTPGPGHYLRSLDVDGIGLEELAKDKRGSHADRETKRAVDSSGTRNTYGGAVSPLLASCRGGLPDEGTEHVPSKNPGRRSGALQGSLRTLWACRTALPASEDVHDVRH